MKTEELSKKLEELNDHNIDQSGNPTLPFVYDKEEWFKQYEAAEYLGIHTLTLRRFRLNGEIPFTRVGRAIRYKKSDLDQFVLTKYGRNITDKNEKR